MSPIGQAHAAALPATRALSIQALHTGERLRATFYRNGRYDAVALDEFDHLLRDWRTGDIREIDRGLLDLLSLLHDRVGGTEPFQLISGYRSAATNAALAANSNGVARRSLHVQGMAADIRLPDCALDTLHQAAVSLKVGGVGLYTRFGLRARRHRTCTLLGQLVRSNRAPCFTLTPGTSALLCAPTLATTRADLLEFLMIHLDVMPGLTARSEEDGRS